jgi:hypothetical protein
MYRNYRYLGFANNLEEGQQFYGELSLGSYYGYEIRVKNAIFLVFRGQSCLLSFFYSSQDILHGYIHSL